MKRSSVKKKLEEFTKKKNLKSKDDAIDFLIGHTLVIDESIPQGYVTVEKDEDEFAAIIEV